MIKMGIRSFLTVSRDEGWRRQASASYIWDRTGGATAAFGEACHECVNSLEPSPSKGQPDLRSPCSARQTRAMNGHVRFGLEIKTVSNGGKGRVGPHASNTFWPSEAQKKKPNCLGNLIALHVHLPPGVFFFFVVISPFVWTFETGTLLDTYVTYDVTD